MTTGKPSSARYEGGRLVAGPTNLALPYPYGGTEIGLVRELYVEHTRAALRETAEEFGGVTVEIAPGEPEVVIGFLLRGHDKDMIGLLPGGSAAAGGTLSVDAGAVTGVKLTGQKLLFVPDDESNGIFHRVSSAAVLPGPSSRAQLSYGREYGEAIVAIGTPDGTGKIYQKGKKADITL